MFSLLSWVDQASETQMGKLVPNPFALGFLPKSKCYRSLRLQSMLLFPLAAGSNWFIIISEQCIFPNNHKQPALDLKYLQIL